MYVLFPTSLSTYAIAKAKAQFTDIADSFMYYHALLFYPDCQNIQRAVQTSLLWSCIQGHWHRPGKKPFTNSITMEEMLPMERSNSCTICNFFYFIFIFIFIFLIIIIIIFFIFTQRFFLLWAM